MGLYQPRARSAPLPHPPPSPPPPSPPSRHRSRSDDDKNPLFHLVFTRFISWMTSESFTLPTVPSAFWVRAMTRTSPTSMHSDSWPLACPNIPVQGRRFIKCLTSYVTLAVAPESSIAIIIGRPVFLDNCEALMLDERSAT